MSDTNTELRQIVEHIERLAAEKQDATDAMTEAYSAAKSSGFDTKVLRKVIADRKKDRNDLAEERAVQEMYESALGME